MEILERIQRIQVQQEIFCNLQDKFYFRQNLLNKSNQSNIFEDLPSDDAIQQILDGAFKDADLVAKNLGFEVPNDNYSMFLKNFENHRVQTIPAESVKLKEENAENPLEYFQFQNMKFSNEFSGKSNNLGVIVIQLI